MARLNGKYGAIDMRGNTVIEFQYDYLSPFREGQATAKMGTEKFFINKFNQKL